MRQTEVNTPRDNFVGPAQEHEQMQPIVRTQTCLLPTGLDQFRNLLRLKHRRVSIESAGSRQRSGGRRRSRRVRRNALTHPTARPERAGA